MRSMYLNWPRRQDSARPRPFPNSRFPGTLPTRVTARTSLAAMINPSSATKTNSVTKLNLVTRKCSRPRNARYVAVQALVDRALTLSQQRRHHASEYCGPAHRRLGARALDERTLHRPGRQGGRVCARARARARRVRASEAAARRRGESGGERREREVRGESAGTGAGGQPAGVARVPLIIFERGGDAQGSLLGGVHASLSLRGGYEGAHTEIGRRTAGTRVAVVSAPVSTISPSMHQRLVCSPSALCAVLSASACDVATRRARSHSETSGRAPVWRTLCISRASALCALALLSAAMHLGLVPLRSHDSLRMPPGRHVRDSTAHGE